MLITGIVGTALAGTAEARQIVSGLCGRSADAIRAALPEATSGDFSCVSGSSCAAFIHREGAVSTAGLVSGRLAGAESMGLPLGFCRVVGLLGQLTEASYSARLATNLTPDFLCEVLSLPSYANFNTPTRNCGAGDLLVPLASRGGSVTREFQFGVWLGN